MTTFLFSYRMPLDYTPGRPGAPEAWKAFFDSLGPDLVDPGNPVFESTGLGTSSDDATRLGGYSLVSADDLESAVTMAKGCPALEAGGGVEVGLITEIFSDKRLAAGA
ncbi:MAG TPA: hypothetical protein VID75_06355 [Acidimicrobiales bacterium]|jgi:hypothetical protein